MMSYIILRHGDAGEILPTLKPDSIDLVFTDPPYPKAYKHCYQYLADYCPPLMKTGSSLMTLLGHYQLEEVMQMFHGKLKYRWIVMLSQFSHAHSRMGMGIEVTWKPMLWYVKEKFGRNKIGFLVDGIEMKSKAGVQKKLHKWEQSEEWAEYYIRKLTDEGDTVLDPFMGSGTTAAVCKKLNRNFIGIDIDEKAVETTHQRLESLPCQMNLL